MINEAYTETSQPPWYKGLSPYIALAVLVLLSVLTASYYENQLLEKRSLRFDRSVADVLRRISGRLVREDIVLHGGAGVFAASQEVTRAEWRAYYESQQLDDLHPGVQGIGIARVIKRENLAQHIQNVRDEGFPDYTVWPAGQRDVYTPYIFMEPFNARNRRAFGFDIFSGPKRRAAMERARDTGETTMTGRLRLVTEGQGETQPGFLMFHPLYTKGTSPGTVEERLATIQGYAFAVFRVHDLIHSIFAEESHNIDFKLYDGNKVSSDALMYDTRIVQDTAAEQHKPMFTTQRTVNLYDRQWTLDLATTPTFEAGMNQYTPRFILAAGLVVSLLIFLYLKTLENNRRRTAALIAELNEARKTAERADRTKSVFLANMSHEIRTPMNAILGFAQILARDPDATRKQQEQVESINRAGRHLLALINDILDMSKIEAGMNVLKPTVFGLHNLLDDLQMMFQSRAEAKGLQLIMDRDEDLPYHVFGDEGKLRQILVNLIGNAVKFTETGGVAVRARAKPVDTQKLRLLVEIEDSGPGISTADLERIFDSFAQADAGTNPGGTGLGLTISRRLVELMGGSLDVESEVGTGSCFRFDVILEFADSAPPADTEAAEQPHIVGIEPGTGPWRILVVDDVQNNRDLLRDLLQPIGFEIREAENGAKALEVFDKWSPHAVLMDMRMPVMDGYEATRRIHASEAGRDTPVIAVTASAFKDTEDEVLATGVSAYLRKPFQPYELFQTLESCLDVRYVYNDETKERSSRAKPSDITSGSLAGLPDELTDGMREAVAEGDMARLTELINQVKQIDKTAGEGLQALAERYNYRKLSELLSDKEGTDDH